MSDRPLDTIVDLYEALRTNSDLEARLAGIPEWMEELHAEHTALKEKIDAAAAAVEEAQRERREAEAGTADCQERLKHFQEQISQVRTQREYGALLQEIDTVKNQIKALEEQALAALERQEVAEQELATEREPFAELDERYQSELQKWEAEKPDVARQVEEVRGRVTALREQLQPGVLALFERLYERTDGAALAEVMQLDRSGKGPQMWHCSVCNYRVRPQVVVEIRNEGGLNYCDSCQRILYLGNDAS